VNLNDVWDPSASDQTHNVVSSVIAAYYREMAAKENEAVAVAGGTVLGAKHKTSAELEKIKDDAIAKKKEELQVSLERSLAQEGKLAEDASSAGASLPQINMERDWLRASMDKGRQTAKTWRAWKSVKAASERKMRVRMMTIVSLER
jgi:hypothetical protein